ncbi:glycosyltransferase [Parafrigoribacterium soli]|uniref:glycosyltransferase n=1 Tax=Parafrigoribacterium soli TaxID=3144663 RepID=UPI0032EF6D72
MRIMLWHVHGGWTDAFVRGEHDYLMPTLPERGAWGLGRGGRDWPASVRELAPHEFRDADVDVVVLQRPDELPAAERMLGRRLGSRVPAVYLEHNTPRVDVPNSVHPLSERADITVVHVTHFNRLMWDCGRAPTTVIEHGVRDLGALYTGGLPRLGVVVNEPVRRWRVTGTDLLPALTRAAPLDVYGMGTELLSREFDLPEASLVAHGDVPPAQLAPQLALRRAYLHPLRWTSLGLALLEAMHLGMPVIALATTEAYRAVPPEAGFISTDIDELVGGARRLIDNAEEARVRGRAAREFALQHYGLGTFLERWSNVLEDAVAAVPKRSTRIATSTEGNQR